MSTSHQLKSLKQGIINHSLIRAQIISYKPLLHQELENLNIALQQNGCNIKYINKTFYKHNNKNSMNRNNYNNTQNTVCILYIKGIERISKIVKKKL